MPWAFQLPSIVPKGPRIVKRSLLRALALAGFVVIAAAQGTAEPSADVPQLWGERVRAHYSLRSVLPEVAMLLLVVAFCVNIFRGKRANERIVLHWAKTFCGEGSLLERNFALLGPDESDSSDIILKESMNEFKLYGSGRRGCAGMLATLRLLPRQDLLQNAGLLLFPAQDEVHIEIYMSEATMEPMVLAVVANRSGLLKQLRQLPDVKAFTRRIEVARDRLPGWPADRLTILAEQSQTFYDLMTDQVLDLVFNQKAFAAAGRYFRFLHFTSEQPEGLHRQVLRFGFALPPASRHEEMAPLLAAVMVFIDAVAQHKLTPEQRRKADKARQDLERETGKSAVSEREAAAERLRERKRDEEKERLLRMTPEQRAKYNERKSRIEQKRMMKGRTVKA